MDVVDNGRGAEAAERGVRAAVIVELDEGWQSSQPCGIGGAGAGVCPLPHKGPDEALGLAIGLGSIRSGSRLAAMAECRPIRSRAVCPGVVGHEPLDLNPGGPERGHGELESRRGHRDAHAASAAVIDHDLEVVVPEPAPGPRGCGRAAKRAVAAAVRNPAQLLVIPVNERARMTGFITADGKPGRPIKVGRRGMPARRKTAATVEGG